ncbi:MAG: hypothetical protein JRC55_07380 [Deltaproteobacteria bacterium]|nr:hypothetical protein [Deltaproteobacteria bacterium]
MTSYDDPDKKIEKVESTEDEEIIELKEEAIDMSQDDEEGSPKSRNPHKTRKSSNSKKKHSMYFKTMRKLSTFWRQPTNLTWKMKSKAVSPKKWNHQKRS